MIKNIHFQKALFIAIVLLSILSQTQVKAQTVFWSEDFETDGTGSRYSAPNQFIDDTLGFGGSEDYFGRIENAGAALLYNGCANVQIDMTSPVSGQSGSFFMAGEDLDDAPGTTSCGSADQVDFKNLSFLAANGHDINISGASAMTFKILVAVGTSPVCNTTNARWDSGEGLTVFYRKDGGTEVTALCFSPDISCGTPSTSNEPLKTDPNCDGDGADGTIVPNVFTEYSFVIPAGGNSLEIRIEIDADAADEEIAFDNLRLEAITTPLPVKMSALKLAQQKDDVVVQWNTSSEINSNYFAIERSIDGIVFEEIGSLDAYGNSEELTNYSFLDNNPINGKNYYRVKQVDIDNKFGYSSIASIDVIKTLDDFAIIPNPSASRIKLYGLNTTSAYKILDGTGRTVQNGIVYLEEIDISVLPKGFYFLQVVKSNGLLSTKQLIKK
jgi:hypothetical protein